MSRRLAMLPLALLSVPTAAQVSPFQPVDLSSYAKATDLAATNSNMTALQTAAACKWTYVAGSAVTIGNTTTETSIASAPQQGTLTIPACATASAFEVQMHVDGQYTAATVNPGTLTQNIKFNGVTVCRVVLGNLATTGTANLGAHGNAYISVNSSGAVKCTGFLGYQITAAGEAPGYWATVGTPTITPGAAIVVDYTGVWSAAVNTITATALIGTIQR